MTASKPVLVSSALLLGLLALALALRGALNVAHSGAARASTAACVPQSPDQVGWWTGDGHAQDIVGLNHGSLEAWSRWGSDIRNANRSSRAPADTRSRSYGYFFRRPLGWALTGAGGSTMRVLITAPSCTS